MYSRRRIRQVQVKWVGWRIVLKKTTITTIDPSPLSYLSGEARWGHVLRSRNKRSMVMHRIFHLPRQLDILLITKKTTWNSAKPKTFSLKLTATDKEHRLCYHTKLLHRVIHYENYWCWVKLKILVRVYSQLQFIFIPSHSFK